MTAITAIRAANATAFNTTTYRPTALFVGGTSGIGEGTAGAFARATKGKAHILLCGRNKENAERIISTFPQTPDSRYEFIECDASLMTNVVKAAKDVKSRIAGSGTINYIVLSQGIQNLNSFDATSEGIDRKLALHFYSRWKVRKYGRVARQEEKANAYVNGVSQFVDELLPCLEKAADKGQEARAMSILNPSVGAPLDVDDIGLKKSYSLLRVIRQVATYNDIMVNEYAKRYPSISFMHTLPGYVNTTISKDMPWIYQKLSSVSKSLVAMPINDCGERMTAVLTSDKFKKGGFYVNQHGEQIGLSKIHADERSREALVAHYTKEMTAACSG